jgi:hypothetical protein
MSVLEELLFQKSSSMLSIVDYVKSTSLKFLPGFFCLSLAIEYFRDWNFLQVLKQLVVVLIALMAFKSIHIDVVDHSFEAAQNILDHFDGQNEFLKRWKNEAAHRESSDESFDLTNLNIKNLTSDVLSNLVWIICLFFFILLKQLYSFVYYLTLIFFPICALLSLLPITRGALAGAIKSSMWCMLMPFILAIAIVLLGQSLNWPTQESNYLVSNLEGILRLCVCLFLVLLSTLLAQKIIDGTGVSSFASSIGQMATMTAMLKSNQFGLRGAVQGPLRSMKALGWGLGSTQQQLGQRADRIRDKYGMHPKVKDIAPGFKNRANIPQGFEGMGSFSTLNPSGFHSTNSASSMETMSGPYQSYSSSTAQIPRSPGFLEKAVLSADKVVNVRSNSQAKKRQINHAASIVSRPGYDSHNKTLPLANYKKTKNLGSIKDILLGRDGFSEKNKRPRMAMDRSIEKPHLKNRKKNAHSPHRF